MKQRNPRFGCRRIAQQITKTFEVYIDKDLVRRVLVKHLHPMPGDGGPSWLTFIGHTKDSLWSIDLFRCESILLKSHWVLIVFDQFTRRIIGFGVHSGNVDGIALCRMFNTAISTQSAPRYLSSDNDPLFQYHRWRANLRILDVVEIKSIPYTPISHPFIERLIGTIRGNIIAKIIFRPPLLHKLEFATDRTEGLFFNQFYSLFLGRPHDCFRVEGYDTDNPADTSLHASA